MTKDIRLYENFKLPNGMKYIGGYDFCHYNPDFISEGESYRVQDIIDDSTNVPIYVIPEELSRVYRLRKQKIPEKRIVDYIVRHENIEFYGFHYREEIQVPTAKADEFLAMTFKIPNPDFSNDRKKDLTANIFEEIG